MASSATQKSNTMSVNNLMKVESCEAQDLAGAVSNQNQRQLSQSAEKTDSERNLAILLTTPPTLPDKKLACRGPKKALTLGERMTVIKLNEEGKSTRQIAQLLGVGRTQIQLTVKRKDEYIHNYNQNARLEQRRQVRKTGNEGVNELCWKWYQEMSRRNIKINGPMLKERALNFAAESGNKTFKASNGWLESFLKRHNIVFGKLAGESTNSDPSVVADWKKKVKSLCEGYEEKDIFNLDESALFFRMTGEKSFYVKEQQCLDGEKASDRLTVMLCANMLGERETAVVVGDFVLSKYLTDAKIQLLPVDFKLSFKSWMNSATFISWITGFNNKMALQQRHVILFLDNAHCHQYLQLSNIKLQYMPPNVSSSLQPLQQGAIQDFKKNYRRKQLSFITGEMEAHPHVTASELMKKSTVLDSIFWIAASWKAVSDATIRKCFLRCGCGKGSESLKFSDFVSETDVIPPEFDRISSELIGGTFSDLYAVDDAVAICDMNAHVWAHNACNNLSTFHPERCEASEDEIGEEQPNYRPTFAEANDAIKTLCKYAQCQGLNQIVDQIFMVQESLVLAKCNQKQEKIDEFLKSYI